MDRWKAEQGRGREKRKSKKKEDAGARKGGKVAKHCVFSRFCGSGGLKRRVRSQLARWEMKKCTLLGREAHFEVKMYKTNQVRTTFGSWDVEKVDAVVARSTFWSQNVQNTQTILGPLLEVEMSKKWTPLWREARFEVKMYKANQVRTTFGSWDVEKVDAVVARSTYEFKMYKPHHSRTTFGSWDVEKVDAVVARSTFWSQNVQNKPGSDHFWKLRCRKSGRRCGAKHILKSKCTKHTILGPLLEVEMLKKWTPLWREAHFEVKMYKTNQVRTTFGCSDVASLHYTTLHFTTLRSTTLHYITQHYNYNYTTTLHYTPLHYITLHYTTLDYTTLHYTTLLYTTLRYLPLHFTTLHHTSLHCNYNYNYNYNYTTTLHYNTLHYTPLH